MLKKSHIQRQRLLDIHSEWAKKQRHPVNRKSNKYLPINITNKIFCKGFWLLHYIAFPVLHNNIIVA